MSAKPMAIDFGRADSGKAVLHAFFQLFKTAQIHAPENQALARPIETMVALSAELTASDGRLSLQAKDRAIFVNGSKVKVNTDEFAFAEEIFKFFHDRGIGGFVIDAPLTHEMIRKLLMLMVYAPAADRRLEKLEPALKAAEIPVRLNKPLGGAGKSESDLAQERRSYTFFTYSKLVVLYRTLLAEEKINASRRQFLLRKIARTIQGLVDICIEDRDTFLSSSAARSGESYAPHHSANTAILSIALGDRLGLNKIDLADVGMAAMFHDVGLHTCLGEILDKRSALDPKERFLIDQHPIQSVEFLLDEKRFNKGALTRVIVAFEHHRQFAGAGYPPASRRPHVVSRIVTIAAVYDALITERPWRRAFLPDEALAVMLKESGNQFDPALLKVFVHMLGLYPVGTLVRLDTLEMGIVLHGSGDGERVSRPVVVLVRDGKPQATVDLTEKNGAAYRRTIVTTEDPARYGIQPSGILAAT
jgi:HD-GYP domain-containing protein (c-di-GMP phosphodiesterase class II)